MKLSVIMCHLHMPIAPLVVTAITITIHTYAHGVYKLHTGHFYLFGYQQWEGCGKLFQRHGLAIIPTKNKTKHINLLAMSTSHGSIWNASIFGVEGKSRRSSRVGNQIPQ